MRYLTLVLIGAILIGAWLAVAAAPVTEAVHCRLNYAVAQPCQMSSEVTPDGSTTMAFVLGPKQVRFVGKSQTGWWSGQLDGQPAMGYELNRGHVVFSTADLKTTFEWWSQGHEHGTY